LEVFNVNQTLSSPLFILFIIQSPRRLSKVLPLYAYNAKKSTRGLAFASGLAPCQPNMNGCLVVTYGSSDTESRAFILEKAGISAVFHKGVFISPGDDL
jgi:hypothetical protein